MLNSFVASLSLEYAEQVSSNSSICSIPKSFWIIETLPERAQVHTPLATLYAVNTKNQINVGLDAGELGRKTAPEKLARFLDFCWIYDGVYNTVERSA